MDTPLASNPVQGRRGKKHRLDLSSPAANDDLIRAIDLIINDQSLPSHLKAAMGCMLEIREQLNTVVAKNKELADENTAVHARNKELEICPCYGEAMSKAPPTYGILLCGPGALQVNVRVEAVRRYGEPIVGNSLCIRSQTVEDS
ncbi:hypothetical protein Q1695_000838 [Nippostrongylus brasiliensis]|nr:hypothetical protein Q1695_000838 [Nippostrongylus brasiliensis]